MSPKDNFSAFQAPSRWLTGIVSLILAVFLSSVAIGSIGIASADATQPTLAVRAGDIAPRATSTGDGWSVQPTLGSAIMLGSTCVDAWDCWAVGGTVIQAGNGGFTGFAQHFNGKTWTIMPTAAPPDGSWIFTAVTCVDANDCWAVGGAPQQSGSPLPLIEHWNGIAWTFVAAEPAGGYFLGVDCSEASSCLAVGTYVDGNGNASTALMQRWNGISWNTVNLPDTGQTYSALNAVTCSTADDCWSVGFAGPNPSNTNFLPIIPGEADGNGLVEQWNGSVWSIVPSPQPTGGVYLSGVTCTSDISCWAVGSVTNSAGSASLPLVEKWDGTSWTAPPIPALEGPAGELIHEITCVNASDCEVVGSSGLEQGYQPGVEPIAAAWNGSAWSSVPVAGTFPIGLLNSVACAGSAQCFSVGANVNLGNNTTFAGILEQLGLSQGYWFTGSDGGVFSFGNSAFSGSEEGQHLNAPVIGMATADGGGYWLAAADGGVFGFGDASYEGSVAGDHLNSPIVGIASTSDGKGYWLVGADGGVFSFGDASYLGSEGGKHLNSPIVGIASTPDGQGYWLVGADGGVFGFGDAGYHGSAASTHLAAPIVGIASTPDGQGYWLIGADGGVFGFGDAGYHGGEGGTTLAAKVVAIAATPDGMGYWLIGADGGVFGFGDAAYLGSEGGKTLSAPIVGTA